MASECNIEDTQDLTRSFDDITCQYGTQSNTGKQTAMEVTKHYIPISRCCAIRCIGMCYSHHCGKRPADTVKEETEKHPIDRKQIGPGPSCNRDDLRDHQTQHGCSNNSFSSIPVRQ